MAALSTNTLENKFVELKEATETLLTSRPKIQKVAEYLRNREKFKKHYVPRLVSMGPIHHGDENLELGEKYKLIWAEKYIEKFKLNPNTLYQRIADNIVNLKSLYAEEVLTFSKKYPKGIDNEGLSWMLFVDGCALLFILGKSKPEKTKDMNIKVDQLVLVMMDVLLLENQLPYLVLKLLWKDNSDDSLLKDNSDDSLIKSMKKFLERCNWPTLNPKGRTKKRNQHQHKVDIPDVAHVPDESQPPTHLLDLQRKMILPKAEVDKVAGNYIMTTYGNIQELTASGIKLKSSHTSSPADIGFDKGLFGATLVLPDHCRRLNSHYISQPHSI
ncbi:uncharacterized protein [Cicer arietinum]|uniref:UPF0481 protein At3g02645 n=1 Tax=Cicer arietinum TaxID=3827 RepID=A0A1S3DVQ5_CICAR|nr:putative UPF0481 protein At3g02645 [Cicer arietinum]